MKDLEFKLAKELFLQRAPSNNNPLPGRHDLMKVWSTASGSLCFVSCYQLWQLAVLFPFLLGRGGRGGGEHGSKAPTAAVSQLCKQRGFPGNVW